MNRIQLYMGCKFSPAIKRTEARNFSSAKTRHNFFAALVKTENVLNVFFSKKQPKNTNYSYRGVDESSQ
jgi:hypothetical protein